MCEIRNVGHFATIESGETCNRSVVTRYIRVALVANCGVIRGPCGHTCVVTQIGAKPRFNRHFPQVVFVTHIKNHVAERRYSGIKNLFFSHPCSEPQTFS